MKCRSSKLGGHVLSCENCHHQLISYNSCRNRNCPKCQVSAAKRWYEARQDDLLVVHYYHVVFTLPEMVSKIAYQNKSVVYTMLFKAAAETLLTIAADPKHLGARIGHHGIAQLGICAYASSSCTLCRAWRWCAIGWPTLSLKTNTGCTQPSV
ncbi:MAG: hypothetical protein ACJAS1_000173 [Oleiphilaceae bacterium]|jgi:hypothetical protein